MESGCGTALWEGKKRILFQNSTSHLSEAPRARSSTVYAEDIVWLTRECSSKAEQGQQRRVAAGTGIVKLAWTVPWHRHTPVDGLDTWRPRRAQACSGTDRPL